jgi:hypothetical protein
VGVFVGWLQGVMFTRCHVWDKLTEVVIFPVFPPGNCCAPRWLFKRADILLSTWKVLNSPLNSHWRNWCIQTCVLNDEPMSFLIMVHHSAFYTDYHSGEPTPQQKRVGCSWALAPKSESGQLGVNMCTAP